MRAESEEGLVPPRPNPGPEPWPEPPAWQVPLAAGLGTLSLIVVATLAWRRRRRFRPDSEASDAVPAEVDRSARGRLIAASDAVRVALIEAFGPGWGSKTTEEIAGDADLAGRLGPDRAEALVGFLRLADRAKFAGGEPAGAEDALAWASGFLAGLGPAGRPSAISAGRRARRRR